ncbi:hypothetical protein ABTX35_19870 [Streptomyces sp. NPDC096080]|uniref:hypothetical protein n=1 Tax=Streptomyces sp. NPDC096080 TaxID=3156693 RepID=UPI0033221871
MSLGDEPGSGGYGGTGQTRTRLPDGPADPRRSGRTSPRSLITVVGVVVLLIAAIAFANRGDGDSAARSGAENKPRTSTTAASGQKPPETTSNGIPTGFPHTQEGAQSAAANYATVLVSADILKPTRRSEIVQQVFATDQQAELQQRLDQAYSKEFLSKIGLDQNGNAPAGHTYVSRTAPIGTKTTSYSETAANVEVWCTGLYGTAGEDSTDPVTSDWFTMTLQLRWGGDDWKVASFSQKNGPAPVPGDSKASSADEMAKAVEEYGGFTYAR